jgi:CHAT domain-containing protein
MKRQVLIGIIGILCFCGASAHAQTKPQPIQSSLQRAYEQGLRRFYNPNPTPLTDSLALLDFHRVIAGIQPNQLTANVLCQTYLHVGIIAQSYDQQSQALGHYHNAIRTVRRFRLTDSLLFKPYLYVGVAHYFLQSFDSSTYYYKKAEQVYLRNPTVDQARRLYNSLGVLYFEAGNYQQSITYYQKAIQINQHQAIVDAEAQNSYMSNIASALQRMEQYDSAATVYKKLLVLKVNRNTILNQLGSTYLSKNDPAQALTYLLQLKQPNQQQAIAQETLLASVYAQQGQLGVALTHLNQAIVLNKKYIVSNGASQKNKSIGQAYKRLGDVLTERKQYTNAIRYYQQAIIQLDNDFNESDISRNPGQFLEGFNSFSLFEALAAKAICSGKMLAQNSSEADMNTTANTYRSALALADHIEKVFDTEEARLFALKKIVPVQQQAVALLIRLYEQTRQETYLEEAFRRSEQSKAAVLYIGRRENENKANTGIPDSLLQRERNLMFTLSQLFMRIEKATTNAQLTKLQNDVRDTKLALSRLSDRLQDFPDYYHKKFGADTINIDFLRRKVLNRHTALLSFYQTDETIYTFALTQNNLHYYKTPSDVRFRQQLSTLINRLRMAVPGETYSADRQAQFVYNRLIKPVEADLAGLSSLILIPHNDLSQLSFEVLEDSEQRYLLERFDITYQYSASFLRPEPKLSLQPKEVLAVAPFSKAGLGGSLGILPASEKEVGELKGAKLTNGEATKTRFLTMAKQASVIHLATHAIANNNLPTQSYIAFAAEPHTENKLYAHELQYGVLNQVKLIFLSACETASGQLIRGEGVMSLSRSLSYAGCPNLVTSLWKAEDKATAYISQQFYSHLNEGNSIARSLQLAKLDLLHNREFAQFHAPPYWSHLLFIGSPAEQQPALWPWLLAGLVLVLAVVGWQLRQR